jgi:excisionase family DNA binding protein
MDRLLTITETAELTRAPVATLRYWRQNGRGPAAFRVGRRLLYREQDVIAWLELCRRRESVRAAS